MSRGNNTLYMGVDLSGLNLLLDELGEKAKEAVRPAAQAAAQVFYEEMKGNAERIKRKTGNLASSIYQAYSPEKSGERSATYHVSWNAKKAPHGGLIEYGHIQRYVAYMRKDGKYITKVRPEAQGKPRPNRRASQAIKDAYYVTLPTPVQVAARPFARPALDKFAEAQKAAEKVIIERWLGVQE